MATVTEKQTVGTRRVDEGTHADTRKAGHPTGWRVRRGAALLGAIAIVSTLAYGASRYLGSDPKVSVPSASTFAAKRGELLITVTEDGNVESASNVDVKCEVAGGSSILWIVEDGGIVKKGDKLVELDSSTLEDEINSQRILYNKAKSAVILAEKNYDVAQIAVDEYLEGTYKKELQTAETQITIAEENLRSAKNSLDYSERMFQRGYISSLELESQQFSVQRAELELGHGRYGQGGAGEVHQGQDIDGTEEHGGDLQGHLGVGTGRF